MKEKPIIFNTEMVKSILDGRKTVTRRPLSKPDIRHFNYAVELGEVSNFMKNGIQENDLSYILDSSPYGQIGDRLYVRETWSKYSSGGSELPYIAYKADYPYMADDDGEAIEIKAEAFKWSPSIHMPKEAARIFLEITDVRVERVQDITEEQAEAEGIIVIDSDKYNAFQTPYRHMFSKLWNSIYKNWDENPWTWVIEFKRIEESKCQT